MKQVFIFTLLFFGACIFLSAQRTLTKEEIFQRQKASFIKKRLPKDSTKFTWSDELNTKLRYQISSLKQLGIDSIVIYSFSYPGSSSKIDSCISKYSTVAYLIWKQQAKVSVRKFNGVCQFDIANNKFDDIFTFYDSHYSYLRDEMFMPIIYSAQITDSNTITYSESISFHEPKYSLYYDISSTYNFFSFGESELNDNRSIFYSYNISLNVFQWWKLISEKVRK